MSDQFNLTDESAYWSSQLDGWEDGNFEYFLNYIRQHAEFTKQDYDSLEIELPIIFNIISTLNKNKNWQVIIDYCKILFKSAQSSLVYLRGYRAETLKYLNMGIEACKQLNDEENLALFYYSLSNTHFALGDIITAKELCIASIELARKHNMDDLYTTLGTYLGGMGLRQGDYQGALYLYLSILEMGSKKDIDYAGILANIGLAFYYMENHNQALNYFMQALEISKDLGDPRGMSSALEGIANVQVKLGLFKEAYENYMKSLEYNRVFGDQERELVTLLNLGRLFLDNNDLTKAEEFFNQSLQIAERLRDQTTLIVIYSSLGDLYLKKNKHDEAVIFFQKSLSISEEIDYLPAKADLLKVLGDLAKSRENYDVALNYYTESFKWFQELEDFRLMSILLNSIGIIFLENLHDYENASISFQKSLEISENTGDKQGKGLSLYELAMCAFFKKEFNKAKELLEQSYSIYQELGDNESMQEISNRLNAINMVLNAGNHIEDENPQ